ncbi:hypothetical protein MMC25_001007 [Agyrium rufum]|nr:hypothetical protein [Agyrium rufum]
MSPSIVRQCESDGATHAYELGLSIVGLGACYPDFRVGPEALETLAKRYYKDTPALKKVLAINRYTGIESRATIGNVDHALVNQPSAPTITDLNTVFREEGVKLSVGACRKALKEWGGSIEDITHVVSTTCTNSANPGFDHYVCKALGTHKNVEKILLHGIGCSGGLAAIRTAANLALGFSYQRKPARVLVLACEISSVLVRSELDSIVEKDEVRIGPCLFSDCASSCIISNGIGDDIPSSPVFDLMGWKHEVLEESENELGFDVDPLGWKVVLTPKVPGLASASVAPAFEDLVDSISRKVHVPRDAIDFDWAVHPGGSTILTGIGEAMGLTPEHMQASYEVYMTCGNSSSATIISVMDRLRKTPGREDVVACAFGPGIILEMMALRRRDLDDVELVAEPVD